MWHIFVKAIDNYGDMSIAWRLASGLVDYGQKVTLFIEKKEDIQPILKLQPNISFNVKSFNEASVEIEKVNNIISVFDAPLPPDYLDNIQHSSNLFIYEYLSAESWVKDFHMKPSLSENSFINKRYFYPGFNDKTGGLLRERYFSYQESEDLVKGMEQDSHFQASFFYYSHTSSESIGLIKKLKSDCKALILDELIEFQYLKKETWVEGFKMMAFADYDRLLQSSNLNFVRGEDSLTRAIFCGKPFIWQPYVQENNHHLVKLEAFINYFFSALDESVYSIVRAVYYDWSQGLIKIDNFSKYLDWFDEITSYHQKKSKHYLLTKNVFENLINDC
jgi:uncharacterized repeat protein (TIGR03837 family)